MQQENIDDLNKEKEAQNQKINSDKNENKYAENVIPTENEKKTDIDSSNDAKSKEMIWRDGDTEYYPGGPTDPNYCVLKFTAIDGRFYSDYYPRSFVIE
jgi:general stress protein 26